MPPTAYRCSINPSSRVNSLVGWRCEHWTDEFQQVVALPPPHPPLHLSFISFTLQALSLSFLTFPLVFLLSFHLSLTSLVLGGVRIMDLIVEPHVGHRHTVLGQCARLVGADGGGGAESLYGLQVLY